MSTTAEKTIGELAAESGAAARVLEQLGIDYCCGGRRTLEQACGAAGIPLEEATEALALAAEAAQAAQPDRDWTRTPLADLIGHIRGTHHAFTRAEIARLEPLFDKVVSVYGARHAELTGMRAAFHDLAAELSTHLMKEEMVLFPYIVRLEEAALENSLPAPAPFGSVRNPIAMMAAEHDGAGEALRQLRSASIGYTAPIDACLSFQTLYQALAAFEADLHQHIHLENNILFPRAIELERRAAER